MKQKAPKKMTAEERLRLAQQDHNAIVHRGEPCDCEIEQEEPDERAEGKSDMYQLFRSEN